MKATEQLHDLGQSLWLDNITRELLDRAAAALHRRILGHRTDLESDDIRPGDRDRATTSRDSPEGGRPGSPARSCSSSSRSRISGAPPTCSCPIHERTDGVDGWVSLEVSPLLAHDPKSTVDAAKAAARARGAPQSLHQDSRHPRDCGHRGVDLRGRADQRDAAVLGRTVSRCGRGLHARHRAADRRGARPHVGSVASVFMSAAGTRPCQQVPPGCRIGSAIAVGRAHLPRVSAADGSRPLAAARQRRGRMQRLLWASTSTKDPSAPDTFYVDALARTGHDQHHAGQDAGRLRRHGQVGEKMPSTAATPRRCSREFAGAGVDVGGAGRPAARRRRPVVRRAWKNLLRHISQQRGGQTGGTS